MRIGLAILFAAMSLSFPCWGQIPMDVRTGSMEPAHPAGCKVLVNPFSYSLSQPDRFDIVAFHPPPMSFQRDLDPKTVFFSRIIGLPGETIGMTTNSVTINGQPLVTTNGVCYGVSIASSPFSLRAGDRFRLSTNEFFVLGDNVANAMDSRYFGGVPRSNIVGRIVRIVKKDEK